MRTMGTRRTSFGTVFMHLVLYIISTIMCTDLIPPSTFQGLTSRLVQPIEEAILPAQFALGLTDLVSRPTAGVR